MSFPLSVITPLGEMFNDQVESVIAPGLMGQFQVLSSHAPILYGLKTGKLIVGIKGENKTFSISDGVLEVNAQHHCLILAENFSAT